ncbi:hypothetical protein EYF80_002518 [Liparis tanakae]|uniref:Uncharacterized protein n=1 Tax=Liparis tanakae TaxID=230148 RepID=A0A4Z2JAW8_9TELE|nr:hypothetical protein EYF80_002518 [Liparis tanakae]
MKKKKMMKQMGEEKEEEEETGGAVSKEKETSVKDGEIKGKAVGMRSGSRSGVGGYGLQRNNIPIQPQRFELLLVGLVHQRG